ncbi:hypothetical protein [Kocuria sp.]|uniref:hypothetical protein n=1 Tax=Kocuria sp. TaxID=1871328 RepID=UPI0026DF65BB|nr:hypothetical protein [Kocuria sp.]MDO5619030.1 hypothetical protein [Kocuria sp.]
MSSPAQNTSPSPDRTTWRLPQLEHWIIIPLIVILTIGTLGRIISFTPQLRAAESQVLAALEPVRSSMVLAAANFVHGAFSAPMIFAVIAALTAWLVVIRRSARDAAGFAVTAVVASLVCFMTQQIVARPAPMIPGESLTAAETASSMPAGAVCGAIVITLALLVTARHHTKSTLLLAVGGGVTLMVAAATLIGSSAYVLDILAALPVAWAGIALGCGVANQAVPALAQTFGWDLDQSQRKLNYRSPDRSVAYAEAYSDSHQRQPVQVPAPAMHTAPSMEHDDGPITEEIPVIRHNAA